MKALSSRPKRVQPGCWQPPQLLGACSTTYHSSAKKGSQLIVVLPQGLIVGSGALAAYDSVLLLLPSSVTVATACAAMRAAMLIEGCRSAVASRRGDTDDSTCSAQQWELCVSDGVARSRRSRGSGRSRGSTA